MLFLLPPSRDPAFSGVGSPAFSQGRAPCDFDLFVMLDKAYTKFPFFIGASIVLLALALILLGLGVFVEVKIFYFGIGLLLLVLGLGIFRVAQLTYEGLFEKRHDFQQIGALFNLYGRVQPQVRIPVLRGFASSPDFLNVILDLIEQEKPRVIVELGSGVSTIFISEFLRRGGMEVEHLALDHEKKYADITRAQVRRPGSTVVHAPLQEYQIGQERWLWYANEALQPLPEIDLLIIDGPPALLQSESRFPAIPLLWEKLSDRCVVVADDGIRKDEADAVKKWSEQFALSFEYLPTEKGTFLGRKTKGQAS